VVKNAYFTGLSYQSSCEARSYFHMRRPENPQAVAMMKKPGIVKSGDFLDPISKDAPAQLWNFALTGDGETVHVRNMYWDGYSFYAKIDSAEFGGAYFGIGLPQSDIAFMF
jgi:radial spoke head protein 9